MKACIPTILGGWALLMPAFAHYSFQAEYDGNKAVTLSGVLTKVEWTNPHARFHVDVKDQGGTVTNWNLELASPTWYGDEIGRWEGDTLVVDTVGFNDKFWFDFPAHPHTEKLHVIERYKCTDFGHLDFEVTIDDPGAYTRPFTLYGHSRLLDNTEMPARVSG
jgi:uncharacterized protein DUF6152